MYCLYMCTCLEDECFVLPHSVLAPAVCLGAGAAHLTTQSQLYRGKNFAQLRDDTRLLPQGVRVQHHGHIREDVNRVQGASPADRTRTISERERTLFSLLMFFNNFVLELLPCSITYHVLTAAYEERGYTSWTAGHRRHQYVIPRRLLLRRLPRNSKAIRDRNTACCL